MKRRQVHPNRWDTPSRRPRSSTLNSCSLDLYVLDLENVTVLIPPTRWTDPMRLLRCRTFFAFIPDPSADLMIGTTRISFGFGFSSLWYSHDFLFYSSTGLTGFSFFFISASAAHGCSHAADAVHAASAMASAVRRCSDAADADAANATAAVASPSDAHGPSSHASSARREHWSHEQR